MEIKVVRMSLLTDKHFTTVPIIPLTLKSFLSMKVASHFITLALHLVILSARALLCSFPSSHSFMCMCPFSILSQRPLWQLIHLSMLVCCGHTQRTWCSSYQQFLSVQLMIMLHLDAWEPFRRCEKALGAESLVPLHRRRLGNAGMSDFMVWFKMPWIADVLSTHLS